LTPCGSLRILREAGGHASSNEFLHVEVMLQADFLGARPLISFQHVWKRYPNGTEALRDISLVVPEGDFLFLVGASGAGKSSLIRLLIREEKPTQGRIFVDGQELGRMKRRHLPNYRRKVGLVFQDFKLLPKLTVWENVAFALRVLGESSSVIRLRSSDALETVGLAGKLDKYPRELSGGERQRVAIARALVHQPRLIVADEPTGNLDPATGWEIMQLFLQINHQAKATVLMATHNRDIVDLFIYYGVADEAQIQTLRAIAVRANSRGWWHDYSDILPSWFEEYISLEEAATHISGYEVQFVPGLLQTEEYARAVTLLSYSNPKEIGRRVSLRMARQARLSGAEPVSLAVVLDEAALSRPIGGRSVMREQLAHLIEMSHRPNVTVQVLPFKVGGHAAAGGPFSVLHFGEGALPDIVFLEQLSTAQYLEKPDMVGKYQAVMERLRLEAATPEDSRKRLQAILNDS